MNLENPINLYIFFYLFWLGFLLLAWWLPGKLHDLMEK